SPAKAVGGVFRLRSRALPPRVIEIFVAQNEKVGLRDFEVLIIDDSPGRCKATHLREWANCSIRIRLYRERSEDARHVALVGVIRLGLHVPGSTELVAPSGDVHLNIVVSIFAVVDRINAGIDGIAVVTRGPTDARHRSELGIRSFPRCNVISGMNTELD